jgi:hypothetical protein
MSAAGKFCQLRPSILNLSYDDGSVVVGTWLALDTAMTKQPSIERRFMAEGEMMDERFANLYAYMNTRFEGVDRRFDGIDKRFDGIDKELRLLREGMTIILAKLA